MLNLWSFDLIYGRGKKYTVENSVLLWYMNAQILPLLENALGCYRVGVG